jgi:hypothetical protein
LDEYTYRFQTILVRDRFSGERHAHPKPKAASKWQSSLQPDLKARAARVSAERSRRAIIFRGIAPILVAVSIYFGVSGGGTTVHSAPTACLGVMVPLPASTVAATDRPSGATSGLEST